MRLRSQTRKPVRERRFYSTAARQLVREVEARVGISGEEEKSGRQESKLLGQHGVA